MVTPIKKPQANEPKGGSGYLIYSGYYTERELNTKLNSDVKRFGQFASYGEAELMRHTDAILHVMSEVIIEPILSASIDLAGERDGVPQEILDTVWEQLFVTLDQPFEVFERQALLDAPWYGFAAFEEEWALEDGRLRLSRFHQRMPWTIRKWHVEGGKLLAIEQWARRGDNVPTVGNVELPAGTLTLFVHDQRGDDFRGQGMYRSVHPLYFAKQELMRARIIGHNRNASGVPYFKYDTSVPRPSGQDEDDARDFLQNVRLHEGSWVEPPYGAEPMWFINAAWAGQAKEIREDIESINGEILMRFKHPALGLGIIGQGSRAVAEGQDSPRVMGIEGLARSFAATMNGSAGGADHTGVIRRIVDGNFLDYGKGERSRPYPRFTFTGIRSRKLVEFFDAVAKMAGSGIPMFKSIAEAAYNELGVELPTEFDDMDEELKKPPAPMGGFGMPPIPAESSGITQEPDGEDGDDEGGEEVVASRLVGAVGWKPSRELIGSEKLVSFAKINDRLDLGVADHDAVVRRVVMRHAPLIARAGAESAAAIGPAVAALEVDLRRAIDSIATELAGFGYETVRNERERGRQSGEDALDDAAEETRDQIHIEDRGVMAARIPGDPDAVAEDILLEDLEDAIEADVSEVAGAVRTAATQARAERTVAEETATGFLDRLESAIVTGSQPAIRRAGFGLTAQAFSIGRDSFAEQFRDEIREVRISEVGDGNMCGPCGNRDHDGRVFAPDDPELDQHRMPYRACEGGPKCRGAWIWTFIDTV